MNTVKVTFTNRQSGENIVKTVNSGNTVEDIFLDFKRKFSNLNLIFYDPLNNYLNYEQRVVSNSNFEFEIDKNLEEDSLLKKHKRSEPEYELGLKQKHRREDETALGVKRFKSNEMDVDDGHLEEGEIASTDSPRRFHKKSIKDIINKTEKEKSFDEETEYVSESSYEIHFKKARERHGEFKKSKNLKRQREGKKLSIESEPIPFSNTDYLTNKVNKLSNLLYGGEKININPVLSDEDYYEEINRIRVPDERDDKVILPNKTTIIEEPVLIKQDNVFNNGAEVSYNSEKIISSKGSPIESLDLNISKELGIISLPDNSYNSIDSKLVNITRTLSLTESSYTEDSILPDLSGQMQYIESMMKAISLNEQNKQFMRKSYEQKIPIINNKKSEYSNFNQELKYISSAKISDKNFRLNLILDIDSTLIFAEHVEKFYNKEEIAALIEKEEAFIVEPNLGNIMFRLVFKIRKNVIEFIKKTSQFCNIYINTHGHEAYGYEVIKILSEKSGVEIKKENLYGIKVYPLITPPKTLKVFSEEPEFQQYSLIFDDNVMAWDGEYNDNIIPSLKYQSFNKDIIETKKHPKSDIIFTYSYLMSYNRVFDCNDYAQKFYDENKLAYTLENDTMNKTQISYVYALIEKVYKLCVINKSKIKLFIKVNAANALSKIKQNVLVGLKVNIEYLGGVFSII
jgi:hypothetical protein